MTSRLVRVLVVLLISARVAVAEDEAGVVSLEKIRTKPGAARAREAAIESALRKRITVDFQNTPLREALEFIQKASGMANLHIDEVAFQENGTSVDQPIHFSATNATAGQILYRILKPLVLTWRVADGTFQVTTEVKAEEILVAKSYDVTPILDALREHRETRKKNPAQASSPLEERSPEQDLIHLIQHQTSGPWSEIDGLGGTATVLKSQMIVRQTRKVHEQIDRLIYGLHLYRDGKLKRGRYEVVPDWSPVEDDLKIRTRMNETIAAVDFQETPLNEAIDFLRKLTSLPIVIEQYALDEEGVAVDEPVKLRAKELTLHSVLNQMLEPLGLTTVVDHGFLVVTTTVRAEEHNLRAVYDVRDLVDQGDFGPLVDVLENQTAGPWFGIDGTGGMATGLLDGLLVVTQTEKVHGEIVELLCDLREKKPAPEPAREAPPAAEKP